MTYYYTNPYFSSIEYVALIRFYNYYNQPSIICIRDRAIEVTKCIITETHCGALPIY